MFNYYLEHWDDFFHFFDTCSSKFAPCTIGLIASTGHKVWWYKRSQEHQLDGISSPLKGLTETVYDSHKSDVCNHY